MLKIKSRAVRYGIYSFGCIALFFLLMKLFSLENVTGLRFVNILFVVFFTNRLAKKNHLHEPNEYLAQWSQLILCNVVTVALSFFAFILYANVFDPQFMQNFKGGILWNNQITFGQAAMSLFAEGIGVAVAISFIVMQYWNDMKEQPKTSN